MYSFRIVCPIFAIFLASTAHAQTKTAESLTAEITPATLKRLECLTDGNTDKLVKVDLKVTMPDRQITTETPTRQLSFWDTKPPPNALAYDFPREGYVREGKGYAVKGYYMLRYGGMNQGISSMVFEKPDAAAIQGVTDVDVGKTRCKA